jgi:hypothetical protein
MHTMLGAGVEAHAHHLSYPVSNGLLVPSSQACVHGLMPTLRRGGVDATMFSRRLPVRTSLRRNVIRH